MTGRTSVSSSGLFLIELLFGLLIFAFAAAVCLQVFVGAHMISEEASRLNNAVIVAQSGAESFRASRGDLGRTAELMQNPVDTRHGILVNYFDSSWNSVADAADAYFMLEIRKSPGTAGYAEGVVIVRGVAGDAPVDPIFAIPVVALEVFP